LYSALRETPLMRCVWITRSGKEVCLQVSAKFVRSNSWVTQPVSAALALQAKSYQLYVPTELQGAR